MAELTYITAYETEEQEQIDKAICAIVNEYPGNKFYLAEIAEKVNTLWRPHGRELSLDEIQEGVERCSERHLLSFHGARHHMQVQEVERHNAQNKKEEEQKAKRKELASRPMTAEEREDILAWIQSTIVNYPGRQSWEMTAEEWFASFEKSGIHWSEWKTTRWLRPPSPTEVEIRRIIREEIEAHERLKSEGVTR